MREFLFLFNLSDQYLFSFECKSIMQNFLFLKTSCKQFCIVILFFNLLSCCLYRFFQIHFFYCITHLKFHNNCRITIIPLFGNHRNVQIHFPGLSGSRKYLSVLLSIPEQIHDKTVLVHFYRLLLHLHQNN